MKQNNDNVPDLIRKDRKGLYESLGIKTGFVGTQVHPLLLLTAAELCWAAEQARGKAQSASEYSAHVSAKVDEERYGAAAILLVVAALEGAIHTAAAIVGEKYAAELPTLELCLGKGKRTMPPRELPSSRRVSLVTKWRDVPGQLTIPAIVAPNPDGSSRQMKFADDSPELNRLRKLVDTRNELLQHHHARVDRLPLGMIQMIQRKSQNDTDDHMSVLHSTERYDGLAARGACVLAADLISPLHERFALRGFWGNELEQTLRGCPATRPTDSS